MSLLLQRPRVLPLHLLAFSLLAPFSSLSQGVDVHGVVVDSITREPVAYANLRVLGTPLGAAANATGFYFIPEIPPGTYQFLVTAVGYRRHEETITVGGGANLKLDVALTPAAVELGEVVVTAEGGEVISPPPSGVRRLDREELKAVPVPVQSDAIRSLLILPGVVSTSDVNSRFYVRGGGGDQNLILVDGMRLYSPFHAVGIYSILDPDAFQSVEVYTGAFPAGYGGRLSSVVSLFTKEPRDDKMTGGAEVNLLSSKLDLQGPVTPGLRFSVRGRRSLFPDTFKRLSGIDRTFSFHDLLAKASADVPGLNKLTALVLLTGDDLYSGESLGASYRWRNQLIGFTSHGLSAKRLYLMASLYVSRYSAARVPAKGSSIPPTSTSVVQPGLRIDATLYTSRPGDLYNFGFDFVFPSATYTVVNSSGARRSYSGSDADVSGWFRSQMALGTVNVEVGVHLPFTYLMRTFWRGLEPRIHLSQSLWNDWKVRLAYGRVSQNLVTVNNEDDLIPIFDAWIVVPSGLRPERSNHYVAGIGGALTSQLSINIEAYRKQYSDLVLYNREKITAQDPDFVAGSGTSSGIETLLRLSWDPFDVYFAHTFSRTEVSSLGLSYPPRFDVRHSINSLVQFHASTSFDVSVRWEFKSGYPFTQINSFYQRLGLKDPVFNPFEDDGGKPYGILGPKNGARLPSYHRLDASCSYRFRVLSATAELAGSVVNLYNRKNIFYFERETGRRVNMLPFFPSLSLILFM